MSRTTSRKSRHSSQPESVPILSAAYLKNAKSKKDIISRLTAITNALESDPELDPSDTPGLASLSTLLVQPDSFLHHKDSDVRLHTLLACMELFYVYAPEPPWDEEEILDIFRVMVRMLASLGHTLESSGGGIDGGGTGGNSAEASSGGNSNNYEHYFRILELLSEVKIGVVLVELVRATPTDLDPSAEEELRQEALETLCDLIRTIITCVHVDHPTEVAAHAEVAVSACIEEFDGSVPVQVLDEILVFVGAGPIQWVTNPAAVRAAAAVALAKKKRQPPPFPQSEMPPAQIQQTNPQYLVAAKIIRRTEDKISSPIAALLNGLLSGDTDVVTSISVVDLTETTTTDARGKTVSTPSAAAITSTGQVAHTGADVWSITYELHRIAPQILTTVIGTVASSLVYPEVGPRWRATKLLGRLFAARSSSIAVKFRICFSQWLRRSADTEQKIRETMVKGLVSFLTNKSHETDLCQDVNESLATILTKDPSLDVRLLAIRQVCELAHNATNDAISDTPAMTSSSATSNTTNPPSRTHAHDISVISAELLLAVANRVSSKNKTERRDAITGLAQIFHKHYIRKILRHVQDGGDDCDIEVILRVLHEHCSEEQNKKYKFVAEAEEKFGWIPQKVFECVYFSDATDPELRNRIYQIVDDVLLDGGLTATSRAVGLAIILHGLKKKGKENAFKWMCALFSQRSQLQRALGLYLDARVKAKGCEAGSAEAFTADAEAMEKLEVVASLSSPLVGISSSNSDSSADMASVLKKIHTAKDKHIFRILSTIASPTHSPSARKRAFDELPKRTKGMGAASVAWTKALARRCSMGAFVNFESIEHCIILAQESFEANDCEVSSLFLTCVKTMIASFPALAATKDSFKNLVEFLEVVRTDVTPEAKKELEKYGIVTLISDILAKSASSMPASDVTKGKGHGDDEDTISIYETLRSQLLRLCKNDGTPEQARNSVHALSSLVNPVSQHLSLPSRVKKEKKEFEPLLKALVAPSRLAIPDDSMTSKQKSKIVSVLSAIAAVAECAPYAFNSTGQGKTPLCWGERAIDFSLNAVLLGKDTSSNLSNEEYSSDSGSESENESPAKGRRSSTARGNKTAVASSKGNDKVNISVHCRMICAAIEVLICHIRATIVRAKADGAKSELEAPSTEHIAKVFKTLIEILEQNGRPPSSQNERYCKTTQDQAELRRCAATNLLRLCDANLQLENTHLTPKMWHILSSAFLDKDIHARESIMEELSYMLTGSGKFRHNASSYPPSLRFVALVSLCPDGDHGAHSAANGYAANVGRRANSIKVAATQCIKSLRVTCQATAAQCRSLGREAEKNFEHRLKMKLMPEYSVPYALHLLSFRHETASSGGTLPGDTDDNFSVDAVVSSEASNRMLKKRLKWLFDPLIQSLGAGADNISFLLRMVELLSKCYPVDVEFKKSDDDLSIEDDLHDKEQKHASARLKIITMAARDVLLSYVKKDVNLSAYPGAIFLPGDLFKKSSSVITSSPAYHDSSEDELVEKSKTPAKATNTTDRAKRPSAEKNSSQKRKTVKPVVNEAFDDDMSEESFTKHTRECGSGGSRRSLRSNKNHERSIDSSPGVADAFGDGISPIKAFPSSPVHLSSESLDESPQQPTPELKKRSLKASRSRKDPPKSESTVSEKKLRRQPDPVIVAKRSEDDAEEEESSVESPSKKPKLRKSTEGPMDKFVKRPSRDSAKKRSSYGTNSFAKKDEKKDKKRQGRGDPIVAVERRGSKVQDDAPLDDESKISQSSEESDEMPAKNLRNSRKKQNTVGTAPTSSTSTVPASGSSKKKSRLRVDPVLSVQRSGKSSQEDAFSDENSRISESSADSEKNAKNLRNGVKKNNTGRATPKSTSITRALASNEKKSRRRLDPALTVKRSGSMSKEDAPSDDESKFSQSSAKSEEKSTKPLLSGRNKEPTRKLTPKSVSNTHASVINKRKPRRGVDPVLAVQRSGKKPKEDDLTEDESESCLLSKESEKKPSKPLANGIRNESKGQATSKSASDTPVSESRGRKSRRKKDPVLERKRARMKSHDEVLSDDESEASQSSVESEEKPKQHLSIGKKKQNRGKASAKSASSTPASETSEKKTRRKVDPVLVPKWGGLKSQKIFLLDDQSKSSQSSVESKGKPSKPPTNNQNKKQSKGRASPKSASNTPVSETSGKKSRRKVDAVLMGKRSGNKENVDIESKTKKSIKNETMDYSDYYDDGDDEFDFPSDDLPPKKNASKKQAKKAAPARKAVKAKISMGPNGLSPKVSPSSASKSSTRSLRSKTRRVR